MKGIFAALAFLFALSPLAVAAQPNCTVQTPCVNLTATNGAMSATQTLSVSGVETAGPGTTAIYRCTGASTVCTSASLTASNCSSGTCASGSPWSIVTNTLAQTSATIAYTDSTVSYGVTYNWAITNSWSGTQGGVASGYSGIFQLAIPAATGAAPTTPSTPSGVLVQ